MAAKYDEELQKMLSKESSKPQTREELERVAAQYKEDHARRHMKAKGEQKEEHESLSAVLARRRSEAAGKLATSDDASNAAIDTPSSPQEGTQGSEQATEADTSSKLDRDTSVPPSKLDDEEGSDQKPSEIESRQLEDEEEDDAEDPNNPDVLGGATEPQVSDSDAEEIARKQKVPDAGAVDDNKLGDCSDDDTFVDAKGKDCSTWSGMMYDPISLFDRKFTLGFIL